MSVPQMRLGCVEKASEQKSDMMNHRCILVTSQRVGTPAVDERFDAAAGAASAIERNGRARAAADLSRALNDGCRFHAQLYVLGVAPIAREEFIDRERLNLRAHALSAVARTWVLPGPGPQYTFAQCDSHANAGSHSRHG